VFLNAGFSTLAVHNFMRGFWHRSAVYPLLGFERYTAMEDMKDIRRHFWWPVDDHVYETILPMVEASSAGSPHFAFGVTVATHQQYKRVLSKEELHVEIVGDAQGRYPVGSLERNALENYVNRLYAADASLGRFVDRLAAIPDVTLVVFGDHQPKANVSDAIMIEADVPKLVGKNFVPPKDFLWDDVRMQLVPVVAWNSSGKKLALPALQSMYCLAPDILAYGGIQPTGFWRYVDRQCSENGFLSHGQPEQNIAGARAVFEKVAYYRLMDSPVRGTKFTALRDRH
jgi:hypothetical protein